MYVISESYEKCSANNMIIIMKKLLYLIKIDEEVEVEFEMKWEA